MSTQHTLNVSVADITYAPLSSALQRSMACRGVHAQLPQPGATNERLSSKGELPAWSLWSETRMLYVKGSQPRR